MKKPSTEMSSIRNQISAFTPPGRNSNMARIRSSPWSPRKASENTCAQIRMNITMAVILVVACRVSLSTPMDMRHGVALRPGNGGHHLRAQHAQNHDVDAVQSGQQEARHHRGGEQRADRKLQ